MNQAVYSMTGFAALTFDGLALELKSINSRFFDFSFKCPDSFRSLEPMVREHLTKRIKRGKLEVRLFQATQTARVAGASTGLLGFEVSPERVKQLLALEASLLAINPTAAPLSVAEMLSWLRSVENTQTSNDAGLDDEALCTAIAMELPRAIDALLASRAREGEQLKRVMQLAVSGIRTLRNRVAPLIPAVIDAQRERFVQKFHDGLKSLAKSQGTDLSALDAQTVSEKALAEATAFAIRIDVAEELARLGAHLDEIDNLLNKGGEVGKRLEFLIQELHREANTLGSKSASIDTTQIAVDMKVLVEQLREQVQNLE